MKQTAFTALVLLASFFLMAFVYTKLETNGKKMEENTCQKTMDFQEFPVFGFDEFEQDPFIMEMGHRFNATISKKQLLAAKTILDIVPASATEMRTEYSNSTFSILNEQGDEMVIGESEVLNEAQLALIQKIQYSDNIRVTALCKWLDDESGNLYDDELVYYISVLPEKLATCNEGKDAVLSYIEKNIEDKLSELDPAQIRPGQIKFTISKEGKLKNVNLVSSVGYDHIDTKMLDLFRNIPMRWIAAENSEGNTIDQELMFFYGRKGC